VVAVIRAGGLGDTLLTLPAIHQLHVRYRVLSRGLQGTSFAVIGYPAFWRAAGPLVDRVLDIGDGRFAVLYGDESDMEAIEWLQGHAVLVAWTTRPLGAWVADAVPRLVQASPYPPPGVHAAVWLCQTIGEEMPRVAPMEGWLYLTPMDRAWGAAQLAGIGLERPTIIHPGAGAGWKRWPAASFARVARALAKRGHQVALVEGPADEEAVSAVLARTGSLPLIREPDLRALARMLSQARLFIGNDSGVTHLAAMAGALTVGLFGPTDPVSWAPLGDVRVLRRCRRRATHQGKIQVCGDPECLAAIPVEDVLEVIDIHC
jgi:ADP-heptose:LPS heptosyltransferase